MLHDNLGNPRLRMAVRLALTGGSLVAGFGVAQAQTAPPAPAGDQGLQEVVVTGSRISVPNQSSISPVTVVTSIDIQETGATRIEDVLNNLPQVFAAQGSTVSNGADGTAQVNLRGLGSKRTLVLVNGERLGPGDPTTGGASDINMIPSELVDSVEVLTGGASSVYGADAVAGVVNFKLNDHFEGVKLVADGGIYNHTNQNTQGVETTLQTWNQTTGNDFAAAPSSVNTGAQKSLAFIAGLNSPDGKGNATFYATYRNIASVLQSQYSISACTVGSGYLAGSYSTGGKFTCSGSSTSYPGRFYNPANGSDSTIGPNGSLIPWSDAYRYNYGPLNYFQRPDERYTAGAFLHYDFNEHASVYASTMFMDDNSVAQIAPSGQFFASQTFNCSNPFLSAAELTAWCGGSTAGTTSILIGRRNVEGGNRQSDLEHTDFRETIGVKGKISDGWDYDANFQYAFVNLSSDVANYLSTSKINNALNVTGTAANPVCASIATNPGCVPWNIFNLGGVTPAALAYLEVPGELRGQITQTIVSGNITGDLGRYGVQLPMADSGLKVNFGVEYRDVKAYSAPDEEQQTGDLSGGGGDVLPVHGGIVSRDAFFEARLPIAEDKFLAKSINFDTGFRYSDYSTGFDTNTFKFGLDWAPVEDIRLRGSFARAVRSPNVVELFSPNAVLLDGSVDPCAGPTPTASLAACERTGVKPPPANNPTLAGTYGNILPNSAAQYNGLLGGNPALLPETAITTSFGIGFTPSFIPNFRAQIDYYNIKIENVITNLGGNTIINECVNSDLYCADVHRDSLGSLWLSNDGYVIDPLRNVGALQQRGVDFDASYSVEIGKAGKLHFNFVGTYVDEYEVTPAESLPGSSYNCAGLYGSNCSAFTGGPAFHWRHTFRTTWQTPWDALDISAAWRYFSPVKLESLSANPNLAAPAGETIANGGISNTDAFIASRSYLDLTASLKVTDAVTLRLGVNNVLDKDPPVIGASNLSGLTGNGNTYPQVYDSLGRYLFATVTAQF